MVLYGLFLLVVGGIVGLVAWIHWDKKRQRITTLVIGGLVFLTFGWWNWATSYSNERVLVCNITGKDRGADDDYRVYTDNCGQLANDVDWFQYKWGSADLWQRIPAQGQVELRIVGIRAPIFSKYPNILDVKSAG